MNNECIKRAGVLHRTGYRQGCRCRKCRQAAVLYILQHRRTSVGKEAAKRANKRFWEKIRRRKLPTDTACHKPYGMSRSAAYVYRLCRCPKCTKFATQQSNKWGNSKRGKLYKRGAIRSRQIRRQAAISRVKMALGCALCGYRVYPESLQLHHIKRKKLRVVYCQNLRLSALVKEMRKCAVVCANCHFHVAKLGAQLPDKMKRKLFCSNQKLVKLLETME